MCSVVPLERVTLPAPVQFPSKPAKGPAACAWLAVTDIMSAAPTPAAVSACPKKPKPKRFIVSFPIKIDVLTKDTSRRIEDLVFPTACSVQMTKRRLHNRAAADGIFAFRNQKRPDKAGRQHLSS